MRDLYRILEALYAQQIKNTVRMGCVLGKFNVGIYTYEGEGKTYFYDTDTLEELQEKISKDFGYLIQPTTIEATGFFKSMPKPPGVK